MPNKNLRSKLFLKLFQKPADFFLSLAKSKLKTMRIIFYNTIQKLATKPEKCS